MKKKKNQVMMAIAALLSLILLGVLFLRWRFPVKQEAYPGTVQVQQPAAAAATALPAKKAENEKTPEPAAASPTPEVTLPIILSHAPTPTPTASPTPTPSPTPEPSPTPVPDVAYGKVNRQSNLRSEASKKGSVLKQVQKQRMVTIHTAVKDDEGNIWYYLTDDDSGTSGWMRDYLVDISSGSVTAEEGSTQGPADAAQYIGTGRVITKSNVRKIMNGAMISSVKKGTLVSIIEAKSDKNGYLWYHIHPSDGSKDGYIKSDLVELDGPLTTDSGQEEQTKASAAEETSGILGRAVTAQQANIRETPTQKGKVVRKLSEGIELQILGMVENDDAQWYLVQTPSGRTKGYARAYTLKIIEKNSGLTPAPYTP